MRWSRARVFDRIFQALAAEGRHQDGHGRQHPSGAHRTAASLLKGRGLFHARSDAPGWAEREAPRRLRRRWQARRAAVDGGADTVLDALPEAEVLIADKGYDSDRLREALAERGVKSCIPGRAKRKEAIIYDKELYKSRNLIERLFGRLKDWRRIATRYDRCAHTFFSAICIAATVTFWLCVLSLGISL